MPGAADKCLWANTFGDRMLPEEQIMENGILIVAGASLGAELRDRPLAYNLKNIIEGRLDANTIHTAVAVISDMWYLSSENLHHLPVIALGSPGCNALSAYFFKRLENALVVDDILTIQMDLQLQDLRVALWGCCQNNTAEAMKIFVDNGYLDKFLQNI